MRPALFPNPLIFSSLVVLPLSLLEDASSPARLGTSTNVSTVILVTASCLSGLALCGTLWILSLAAQATCLSELSDTLSSCVLLIIARTDLRPHIFVPCVDVNELGRLLRTDALAYWPV